jgi:DNA-binding transcriptional MocR family regulator
MSKTLNPAFRVGGLVAPERMYPRIEAALQATAIMAPPLSCAIMDHWLTDGTVDILGRAIQEESNRRMALARSILGGVIREPECRGYHLWLPMPLQEAERLAQAARALGVLVTPPDSTAVDPDALDGGIRLCLGAPSLAELSTGLSAVARLRFDAQASGRNLVY